MDRPRVLFVDDEEAILETMLFTFRDDYEVYTSTDARRALDLLAENAPMAAVLTDQKMPGMDGVEFLSEVRKHHPATVRMVLTGFADMDAIIQSINDGGVYAYVTKPWEPDQLKQLMKRAVDYYALTVANQDLLDQRERSTRFLETVMDQLDDGAIAVDEYGVIQAINRPVHAFLALDEDPRGVSLEEMLHRYSLTAVGGAAVKVAGDSDASFDEIELATTDGTVRLRVKTKSLHDDGGRFAGSVILICEISHEPLRRRFDELLAGLMDAKEGLRGPLEQARLGLRELVEQVRGTGVDSAGMGELTQWLSRSLTAIENWLEVDDALAREDFPDAQLLMDRMRVAGARWPFPEGLPERVRELGNRVREYYESGENPKQRVL
ncbi:response regulator [Myxococcota bacterium]|nr:response regulator [Myxococcota bacterium]